MKTNCNLLTVNILTILILCSCSVSVSGFSLLSPDGPWLIYTNIDDELIAINDDGTSTARLNVDTFLYYYLPTGSSNSGQLAVLVPSASPVIQILQLPQNKLKRNIFLLSYYEQNDIEYSGHPNDPITGVLSKPSWSPDGRYLVFTGAIEGLSSDLYIYDSINDVVKRLSEEAYQASRPSWSPGGTWIIYEEVSNFHGWLTKGIWATKPDGSETKLLYEPVDETEQKVVDWLDENRVVISDTSPGGNRNLRVVNLETKNISSLFSGYYFDVAFDAENDIAAVVPFPGAPRDTEFEKSGFYLIFPSEENPKLVIADVTGGIEWDSISKYFVTTIKCGDKPELVASFNIDGKTSCALNTTQSLSPNEEWYYKFNNGLYLYSTNSSMVGEISDITSGQLTWCPDSTGFFVFTDVELYYVTVPDLHLNLIDTNLNPHNTDFAWVKTQ